MFPTAEGLEAKLINLISPINLYAGCLTKTVIFNLIMKLTDRSDIGLAYIV